jgi:ribosomal protein S18 acetylase RimI-like enzyme
MTAKPLDVRLLQPHEVAVLDRVAPETFDNPIDSRLATEFLADARHHLAVAIDQDTVVGFASGVRYIKPAELWVNELGVAPTHRGRGIGKAVLAELLRAGRELGCVKAWVLTDDGNGAAMAVYRSLGGADPRPSIMLTFSLHGQPRREARPSG